MNYYNEYDSYNAACLRELVAGGLIPDGVVDDRSIEQVQPGDLRGFTQCHFFAGIGGWPLALRLAGWPDDRPVWTGSCPCQSFSVAGKQLGFEDKERHLWPEFFRLIEECRPVAVFGEQVAPAAGEVNGRCWLDLVHDDLERAGYAVGAAVFPAASVGAPHLRDRLYFVADSGGVRPEPLRQAARRSSAGGFWADAEWAPSWPGGERRAIKPGVRPLADGVPNWVGAVHAAGNAIVPQQAAAFIAACVEAMQ